MCFKISSETGIFANYVVSSDIILAPEVPNLQPSTRGAVCRASRKKTTGNILENIHTPHQIRPNSLRKLIKRCLSFDNGILASRGKVEQNKEMNASTQEMIENAMTWKSRLETIKDHQTNIYLAIKTKRNKDYFMHMKKKYLQPTLIQYAPITCLYPYRLQQIETKIIHTDLIIHQCK